MLKIMMISFNKFQWKNGVHDSCLCQIHILDVSIEAMIKLRWLVMIAYHSLCIYQASINSVWRICFFYFSVMTEDFFDWIIAGCWQTDKSNARRVNTERQCNRLHTESVAMLTVNIPVKSDICFQSSPLGSLQQFPWKLRCHFPPLFGPLDILKAFFFLSSLGLLKLARLSVSKRLRICFIWLHYVSVQLGVCMDVHICVHPCDCPSYDLLTSHTGLLSEQGWCWVL